MTFGLRWPLLFLVAIFWHLLASGPPALAAYPEIVKESGARID